MSICKIIIGERKHFILLTSPYNRNTKCVLSTCHYLADDGGLSVSVCLSVCLYVRQLSN